MYQKDFHLSHYRQFSSQISTVTREKTDSLRFPPILFWSIMWFLNKNSFISQNYWFFFTETRVMGKENHLWKFELEPIIFLDLQESHHFLKEVFPENSWKWSILDTYSNEIEKKSYEEFSKFKVWKLDKLRGRLKNKSKSLIG